MSLNIRVRHGRSCKNYKDEFGPTLVSIITMSHYQVHVFFKNVPLKRDRIMSTVSLSFFGRAAAADEVKTFSNPIWKSTAYYTAQFPILSQVRTQTESRAECEMGPRHKTI